MGVAVEEYVVMMLSLCGEVIAQLTVAYRGCLLAGIGSGLVDCDWVKGSEHTDVRQDRCIVFAVAVAVRRDVHCHIDVEGRTVLADSLGIFRHLTVEEIIGIPLTVADSIKGACTDAAAAALADILMDHSLIVLIGDGIGAALFRATTASAAELRIDPAFSGGMLLHLACTAARAHAQILNSAAEARHLVALEMRKADDDICIHNSTADLSRFAVFRIFYRNLDLIRTAQTVGDDDLAARCHRVEAVVVCTVEMLESMLAAARIQCVAVREERDTALRLHEVNDSLCILRTKVCEIAQLTEMHFNGNEFAFHINILNTCGEAETLELRRLRCSYLNTKIRKIDLSFFH